MLFRDVHIKSNENPVRPEFVLGFYILYILANPSCLARLEKSPSLSLLASSLHQTRRNLSIMLRFCHSFLLLACIALVSIASPASAKQPTGLVSGSTHFQSTLKARSFDAETPKRRLRLQRRDTDAESSDAGADDGPTTIIHMTSTRKATEVVTATSSTSAASPTPDSSETTSSTSTTSSSSPEPTTTSTEESGSTTSSPYSTASVTSSILETSTDGDGSAHVVTSVVVIQPSQSANTGSDGPTVQQENNGSHRSASLFAAIGAVVMAAF